MIVRRCAICGCDTSLYGGYYLNGAYACCDSCRNEYYMTAKGCKTLQEAERQYEEDNNEDDSEYFYTDWA